MVGGLAFENYLFFVNSLTREGLFIDDHSLVVPNKGLDCPNAKPCPQTPRFGIANLQMKKTVNNHKSTHKFT